MKIGFTALIIIILSTVISAQNMEEDITVQYMKANVLYNSGRFDEAVRMYNRILDRDESQVMALYMRAKAKYELGAYRGTKNDALTFIDKGGVTKDIIQLMARTEYKLSNFQAANNYIRTALELDTYDAELYYMAGEISLTVNQKNDACERFEKGAQLGHQKSMERLATECQGRVLSRSESREDIQPETRYEDDLQITQDTGGAYMPVDTVSTSMTVPDLTISFIPPADKDASQDIEIDDKLSLQITNGLGERKLEMTPNIFMLSTEDGIVVVDICVNSEGQVINSSFNRDMSTIYRSSLTSLAIRKSREFLFLPSMRQEQCGSIIYYIKS